jgi:hypothetical protein
VDVEQASASIDALIDKRAAGREKATVEEMAWKASVRRHHEKLRRRLKAEWYAYHVDQAERLRRTMTALVERHEAEALKLIEDENKNTNGRRNA